MSIGKTNKIYKVKNDIVFKELFTKEGNEEFLQEFLTSLLSNRCKRNIKWWHNSRYRNTNSRQS